MINYYMLKIGKLHIIQYTLETYDMSFQHSSLQQSSISSTKDDPFKRNNGTKELMMQIENISQFMHLIFSLYQNVYIVECLKRINHIEKSRNIARFKNYT